MKTLKNEDIVYDTDGHGVHRLTISLDSKQDAALIKMLMLANQETARQCKCPAHVWYEQHIQQFSGPATEDLI